MTRQTQRALPLMLAVCLLSGCAPQLSLLPASPKSTTTSTPPAPTVVCTASMMADVPTRPPLPADAGFPAPQTPAASRQVQTYLTWLHSLSVLTNSLIQRANETQAFCVAHQPK
jgi:hypothetical protein